MADRMDMPLMRRLRGAQQLVRVRLDEIDPNPRQPRRSFPEESIASLAESIRRYGLLSPLILLFWIGPWIGLGVAVVVVYVFCNLPFIMIQRYNRPPLVALEARLRRREARRAEKRPEPEKEGNRQDESSDPLG